jgi:putative hydrolase
MKQRPGKKEVLTNSDIAELLLAQAKEASYPLQRAFRTAGRSSLLWPIEAAELVRRGRSLAELKAVGPFLEKMIRKWIEEPPNIPVQEATRENFFTWPEAQAILGKQPDWQAQVLGDLQMHTEWSDGSGTVRSMAEAAVNCGYEYIAITDHAKGLKIAGGINEKKLEEEGFEIKRVNEEFAPKNFRILRSIELNLSMEGKGDMESTSLQGLDLVLGAFHSSLRKTDDQTERYLAALKNPHLHILGHPRGRIYNYRLGLKADWPRVFDLAANLGKAVEIDCYPDRQDMSLDLIKMARDAGAMISLGTDSHHPWQLEFIDLGLAAAAAAKVPKERILNFKPATEILSWANSLRPDRKPKLGSATRQRVSNA